MLQNIRKNVQGTMAKIIVAIIVVPFALFGIESLLTGGGVQYVAEINGEKISAADLQQQINLQKRRLMMSMGDNLDPSMLDDQLLAGPALEFMVQRTLLLQAASEYKLEVAEARLNGMITEMPVFQLDGVFNVERYRQVLSEQGYTPTGFKQALRDDVLMTQLRAGVSGTEFVTPTELEQMITVNEEQRDIRYLVMPIAAFMEETELEETQILAWYEDHKDSFKSTETVDLQVLEVRASDFEKEVSAQAVAELFALEQDSMQVPEVRAVSHILFEQGDDESAEALQARIAEVQAKLQAGEQSFADLAVAYSQDLGSANFGGDLGTTSGDTFPPAMEEAIAQLGVQEVSAPLQTDAGWHLLQVTAIQAGENVAFENVRAELEQRLRDEQARRDLITAVEDLKDLVFNAEDLSGPAAELGLAVDVVKDVTRGNASGALANNTVLAAAFSKDLIEDGYNSEVIELDDTHYIAVRVVEHRPAAARPLAEVRSEVAAQLAEDLSRQKIIDAAEELLARLRAGSTIEDEALKQGYAWQVELAARRDARTVPATLLQRAFSLPTPEQGQSVFEYVQTPENDIEVFELVRVTRGKLEATSEQRRQQLAARMAQEAARGADNGYQKTLADRAEVVKI